jgi:tetratricopeptide (TPR) repeat protein
MRAALRHLADRGDHESLLRLAGALGLFWFRTTPGSEDVDWLDRAVESAPDATSPLLGRALYALAICRGEQGRTDEALAHGRRAYLILRDSADEAWKARTLNTLAGLTRDLGRAAEAIPMLDESIVARRRLADPGIPVTLALTNRAIAALDLGDLPMARRCLAECLELAGTDQVERAMAHTGLADVAIEAGELREAASLLGLSVPVLREAGQHYRLIECLDTLAALAVRLGRPLEAAVLVAAADRALQDERSVQVPADVDLRERRTGAALGELDEAQRAQAARTGEALTLDAALDLATEWLL